MFTIGVIDVGTNSVQALICDQEKNILYNNYQISELGRNLYPNMFLDEEQILKCFKIIENFIFVFKNHTVDLIKIVGTSASREAKNISILSNLIKEKLGLYFEILSGDEEANYSYQGCLEIVQNKNNSNIFIDIGGGSTEIIFTKNNKLKFQESYQLGIQRLNSQFKNKLILSKSDIEIVDSEIKKLFRYKFKNIEQATVYGTGGTFVTFASIQLQLQSFEYSKINGLKLELTDLNNLFYLLNKQNLEERKSIIGLDQNRAHLIHFGLLIAISILNFLKLGTVITSDYGLKHGVAFSSLKKT